jgi:hypothetical protein
MPFVANERADWLGYYASMPGASDSWSLVLLKEGGLPTDDVLADYDTLDQLLLGTADEADFVNYQRKPLTAITRTVQDTPNNVLLSMADQKWTQAGSGTGGQNNVLRKAVFCYVPTTGAPDTTVLPLFGLDILATTDGNDMTVRNPNGLIVVSWASAA